MPRRSPLPAARSHAGATAALLAIGLGFAAFPALAAQAPPSDIWLAPLASASGRITVGPARNLTSHDGYDNQPSWSPDGRTLYFTTVRTGEEADIWRIDAASGIATPFTATDPESEYSPTVTPDGTAISVIRVERDSAQRLWRFPLDGGAPGVILSDVKPVGYHAWADSVTLVLFVLGSPNSLQVADTRTGRAEPVTTDVGRSLHRVPGSRRVSFVHKLSREEWWLELLDPATKRMQRLVRMPRGVEDYDWTPDGQVIAGQGSTLRMFNPKRGGAWVAVGDLAASGLTGITRLAVSPSGDRIAIVATPVRKQTRRAPQDSAAYRAPVSRQ